MLKHPEDSYLHITTDDGIVLINKESQYKIVQRSEIIKCLDICITEYLQRRYSNISKLNYNHVKYALHMHIVLAYYLHVNILKC